MDYYNWRNELLVKNHPNAFYDLDEFTTVSRFIVRNEPTNDPKTISECELTSDILLGKFTTKGEVDFRIPKNGDILRFGCYGKNIEDRKIFYFNENRDHQVNLIPHYVSVNSVVNELVESYNINLSPILPGE
jgi:hypothetical protein